MQEQLSEVLDNILGLLLLEGSYDIEDKDGSLMVSIETKDAGRLIGPRGENLDSLQLLVNNIYSKKVSQEEFKKVVLDVEGWKKQKETYLADRAKSLAEQVKETGQPIDLEPMPSWQRRILHMTVSEMDGVESESVGEGKDRHLVIRPASKTDKSAE